MVVPILTLNVTKAGIPKLHTINKIKLKKPVFLTDEDAMAAFAAAYLYRDRPAEEIAYVIGLNTKCRPVGVSEISHGTIDMALIRPREVYIRALLMGAASIYITHNHVSGNPEPSHADMIETHFLSKVGTMIGIPLVYHIVIGDWSYSVVGNGPIDRPVE